MKSFRPACSTRTSSTPPGPIPPAWSPCSSSPSGSTFCRRCHSTQLSRRRCRRSLLRSAPLRTQPPPAANRRVAAAPRRRQQPLRRPRITGLRCPATDIRVRRHTREARLPLNGRRLRLANGRQTWPSILV